MNATNSPGTESIDMAAICARELKAHDWRLANEPVLLADGRPFVQRVRERVAALCAREQRIADEPLVRRMVTTEYGRLLHHAVSLNGQRVQSRALEETMAYGWPKAMSVAHDRQVAEDAVTWAANLLWQNIHRCQPDKYFPYFIQILLNEIRQDWRKSAAQHEVVVSDLRRAEDLTGAGDDESNLYAGEADAGQTNPYPIADLELARDPLIALLRECLHNEHRLHILFNKIVLQLNPTEIAAQLHMSVKQVYVETHRALARIRENCWELLRAELQLRLANF